MVLGQVSLKQWMVQAPFGLGVKKSSSSEAKAELWICLGSQITFWIVALGYWLVWASLCVYRRRMEKRQRSMGDGEGRIRDGRAWRGLLWPMQSGWELTCAAPCQGFVRAVHALEPLSFLLLWRWSNERERFWTKDSQKEAFGDH